MSEDLIKKKKFFTLFNREQLLLETKNYMNTNQRRMEFKWLDLDPAPKTRQNFFDSIPQKSYHESSSS